MANDYWDSKPAGSSDAGGLYGSGQGAAASFGELDAISTHHVSPDQLRQISADANDVVLRGGTAGDLAAKYPNINRQVLDGQFKDAETRNDWNVMDNGPGGQGSVYGTAEGEKGLDDAAGMERLLTAGKAPKVPRGPHGHHPHGATPPGGNPAQVGGAVNAVDTAEAQQAKSGVSGAIDKMKSVGQSISTAGSNVVSFVQDKLLNRADPQVTDFKDFGKGTRGIEAVERESQSQYVVAAMGKQQSRGAGMGM